MAYPDPPFNSMPGDTGLDIELMTALAGALGESVNFIAYGGSDVDGDADCSDFDGIFARLEAGDFDCVAAGTTVTPARERHATFLPPYLISGQALAVDTGRLPHVHSVDDLDGLTIGVQRGNTSEGLAERLVADGKAERVRVYDYADIGTALTDLTTGGVRRRSEARAGAERTRQAAAGCRGGAEGPLRGEHRDRGGGG